jgi:NAD(P)-dependent dehydrogenase (short-subunit alcohol dehydrogenase family)
MAPEQHSCYFWFFLILNRNLSIVHRNLLQLSLTQKVILVTGASSGIGAATVLALDSAGAKVAMAARRKEKLDDLAVRMHDPLVIEVDLCDESSARDMVRRVVGHFGRIDVLINNAASIIVAKADEVTEADLLRAFSTNLVAPVAATQEAVRFMRKQGGGHIINIGSPGFMMGIPYYAPYVCSKAAFSAWTRTIQAEWAGTEIVVSEYFPGYIRTDSLPDSRLGAIDQDFLMAERQNFLTRLFTKPGTPGEVARHLVRLILKPEILVYSGFSVKFGAFISNIPRFRLNLASQLAKNARAKRNLTVFTG